jgi:hypothetical protein
MDGNPEEEVLTFAVMTGNEFFLPLSIMVKMKRKGQEDLVTSWAKSPYFSVFPASPSPYKLIGSSNPGHDGGLVGRLFLPTVGRREKNHGKIVYWSRYFQG